VCSHWLRAAAGPQPVRRADFRAILAAGNGTPRAVLEREPARVAEALKKDVRQSSCGGSVALRKVSPDHLSHGRGHQKNVCWPRDRTPELSH